MDKEKFFIRKIKNRKLRKIFWLLIFTLVIYIILEQILYMSNIDFLISKEFSSVMYSHDISALDAFFDDDPIFQYDDVVNDKTYKNNYSKIRTNVVNSFSNDGIHYKKNNSRGRVFDSLISKHKEVAVVSYIPNVYQNAEIIINFGVEITGYKKYKITKVTGMDPLFGYIFLGIEPTEDLVNEYEKMFLPPD